MESYFKLNMHFLMGVAIGAFLGWVIASIVIGHDLDSAGIKGLAHHETKIDGKVSTNWVEIVWKDGVE